MTDSERRLWSSLTRRNSSNFALSAAGSTKRTSTKMDKHGNPVAEEEGHSVEHGAGAAGTLVEMKTKHESV